MKINISDIPENKTFNDYPDDTLFVHKESSPRYILEPFEIISVDDPRYKNALTREKISKMIISDT